MITKQQYVRLSLLLFLPLLGLGYYLAERRIFNPLEHAVFCVVDDGTCTISKMDERKLQENLEDSIFIFQDTKASLSVIPFPLRSYTLDKLTSEYVEAKSFNYLGFYQCAFQIFYAQPNLYTFDCYPDKEKTAIVSGKFEFVNSIDEQFYLKTHASSLETKKKILAYQKKMFYLTLLFPLAMFFLISWLVRFIVYGFKDSNQL